MYFACVRDGSSFRATSVPDHSFLPSLLLIMNIIYLTLTMIPVSICPLWAIRKLTTFHQTEVDELTQVSYVVEFSEP